VVPKRRPLDRVGTEPETMRKCSGRANFADDFGDWDVGFSNHRPFQAMYIVAPPWFGRPDIQTRATKM
jgi:hypothetical protein